MLPELERDFGLDMTAWRAALDAKRLATSTSVDKPDLGPATRPHHAAAITSQPTGGRL